MVCSANMNRSMEAHKVLLAAGLDVSSYGAGQHVKIPGCVSPLAPVGALTRLPSQGMKSCVCFVRHLFVLCPLCHLRTSFRRERRASGEAPISVPTQHPWLITRHHATPRTYRPSQNKPNVYNFGEATYKSIYDDLMSQDPELYRRNGEAVQVEHISLTPC